MSRRANPALVGAFVLGALALAVAGVTLFGSGRLFRETTPFVCYFEGGVHGLNPGAPVKFKGVEIGSVKRILLRFEQTPGDVTIPVFLEVDSEKFERAGLEVNFAPEAIKTAIEQGLRARLESESLVTGLLFVNLDFFPGSVARLIHPDGGVQEIPTLPTTIEQATLAVKQILDRLENIDLKKLVDSATATLDSVRDIAASGEVKGALASLDRTLQSVQKLSQGLDRSVGPLAETLRTTAERAQVLEDELRKTLDSTRSLIEPGSPLSYQLQTTLEDVSAAARSVRSLAETLERDPSAVVRGRGERNP
jgi:paraquat-inducible protein B